MDELNFENGDKMDDAGDEILQEQQLRNLTRSVSKFFNAVFALEKLPTPPAQTGSTASLKVDGGVTYSHSGLVDYILRNEV